MIARTTTISSMKTYRYNLQRSGYYMNRSMNTVQTGRIFNSFADDPATAALSFQKRRALLRNSAQRSLNTSIQYKYQQAWTRLRAIWTRSPATPPSKSCCTRPKTAPPPPPGPLWANP